MTEPSQPAPTGSAPTGPAPTRLVVVTGAGRSGTSTVAGALKRLGLHIPQPEIEPDETNPRGFYEPAWVVAFHKRLLSSVPARTNDARPRAAALVKEVGDAPEVRAELVTWLAEHAAVAGPGGQLVVKDPRAFWFHDLWKAAAAELGIELGFLTMVRHPAEVARSRDTSYLQDRTEEFRRVRQTANIAGWVNGAFETELATRSHPRAFVRYSDLMTDWRGAMRAAGDQLGLTYDAELAPGEHHAVDDFIDVGLHRARVTWDDLETLPALRSLAETCWEALNRLVEAPDDLDAIGTLAQAHPSYVALHELAEGIVLDHTNCEVVSERRRVRDQLAERHDAQLRTLRRKLRAARQGGAGPRTDTGADTGTDADPGSGVSGRVRAGLARVRRR